MFNLTHPRNKDNFRSFLSETSLPVLILYYVLFNSMVSIAYSFIIFLINGDLELSFWSFYLNIMFDLLGNHLNDIELNGLILLYLHRSLSTYYSILVPAILLGVVVFKVMISSELIIFRNYISLHKSDLIQNILEEQLHIRFYNSSRIHIYNVSCKAYLRIIEYDESSKSNYIKMKPLSFWNGENCYDISVLNRHIPFTLMLKVDPRDITFENGEKRLKSLQGHPLVENMSTLMLLINGDLPKVDGQIIQEHKYNLKSEISFEPFNGVQIDDEIKTKKWKGWQQFDLTEEGKHEKK